MIATRVGGVAEVVRTARTACSSRPATRPRSPPRSSASSPTPELRERLRAAAAAVGRALRARADLRAARGDPGAAPPVKPRVLIVGRTRYRLPLDGEPRAQVRRARGASSTSACSRARATGRRRGDDTFRSCRRRGRSTARASRPRCRSRVARELRVVRPDAVLVQSPYEAARRARRAALAREPREVIVEVHGDWRTATRLYGSRARGGCSRRSPTGRARGGAPRRRGPHDLGLHDRARARASGVEPAATFPAFMDLEPFLGPPVPLPERAAALFVGVLERYKDVDGLADGVAARRAATARARRSGSSARAARARSSRSSSRAPGASTGTGASPTGGGRRGARRRDGARAAVALGGAAAASSSRRSAAAGRSSRTRVGGIADLVDDGENGLLVEPRRSTAALADALVRVLTDRALAERLAAAARPRRRAVARDAGGLRAPDARARRAGDPVKPRALFVGRDALRAAALARPRAEVGRRSASGSTTACSRAATSGDRAVRAVSPVSPRGLDGLPSTRCSRSASGARSGVPAAGDRRRGPAIGPRSSSRGRWPGGAPVIVAEVHGNWRHSTRLYGSPARRCCRAARRRARRVRRPPRRRGARALRLHGRLVEETRGRPPTRSFPTYSDLERVHREASLRRCPDGRGAVRRRARAVQERRGARATPGGVVAAGAGARLVVVGEGLARAPVVEELGVGASTPRAAAGGGRRQARRGDRARAALALRGPRPRRDRGLRARPRGRRDARRRDPRSRRGRRARACSSSRRTRRRSPTRSSASSPSRALAERLGRRARRASRSGTRRPSSSPSGCGRSSTPSRLTRRACGRAQAAAEERRLPLDRRGRDRRRRRRHGDASGRCACSCTTRSTTSTATRSRCRSASSTSRWRSSASSATRRLARRRDRPLRRAPAAAARRGADHLRRRLPRQPRERGPDPARHGYPAVLFVPIGYLGRSGRCRTTSTSRRAGSSTGRSTGASSPSSSAGGVRVESHGIGHRPLADLEVDEAAREITLSKLRLEERARPAGPRLRLREGLGGALPAGPPEPAQAGGLRRRLHVDLGRRTARTPIRSSSTATTSSRTRRARSSSCSPAPAT